LILEIQHNESNNALLEEKSRTVLLDKAMKDLKIILHLKSDPSTAGTQVVSTRVLFRMCLIPISSDSRMGIE